MGCSWCRLIQLLVTRAWFDLSASLCALYAAWIADDAKQAQLVDKVKQLAHGDGAWLILPGAGQGLDRAARAAVHQAAEAHRLPHASVQLQNGRRNVVVWVTTRVDHHHPLTSGDTAEAVGPPVVVLGSNRMLPGAIHGLEDGAVASARLVQRR